MGPSTQHMGVLRIPGRRNNSDAGARVDVPAGSNGSTHERTTDGRPASFSIHYSNIRGLRSNFSSVEYHLASFSRSLLLLSRTKLSGNVSPVTFNISYYNLYSRFCLNGGVRAYCNINMPISKLMDLEFNNFDVLWLKICLLTITVM